MFGATVEINVTLDFEVRNDMHSGSQTSIFIKHSLHPDVTFATIVVLVSQPIVLRR